MKNYIKKIQPERIIDKVESVTCDLCGATAKNEGWQSSQWEINETEIEIRVRHKDGSSYPEGGWGTKYQVDICPDCFTEKLIPWFESQGCKAKREDWDW